MKKIFLTVVFMVVSLASACFAQEVYLTGGQDFSGDSVMVTTTKDPAYYHYTNEKYGFAIDVPSTVERAFETDPKDGCNFYDDKGNASFIVYGTDNFMHMSLQELYNIDMSSNNSPKLNYKQFGKDWYGIAWEKNGMTFYKKVISHGTYYNSFAVTYPTAKKDKYQAIIRHMNETFVAVFKE